MTINQQQDEIIEEFSDLDDWMDRYAYIIDLGNTLPPISEEYKTPEYLIEGCQSRVWLNAEDRDGHGFVPTWTKTAEYIIPPTVTR